MQDKTERLSVVFHPMQGDEGSLSVAGFSSAVDGLRKAVSNFSCKDLTVVSLSSNSPITMTIEGAGSLSAFHSGLSEFMDTREIPAAWARSKIDAVLEFLAPIGRSVGHFNLISSGAKDLVINPQYRVDFENSLKADYSAVGTIDGMLDAVNIHGKKNALTVYPSVGKNRIICEFDTTHLDNIKNLIGQYVEISGEMKYRWRDKYPHKGVVGQIVAIEEDTLPRFSDLYGMAPNAARGIPAEDFIAGVRSEWISR